jgi:hypothetical protein
METGAVNCHAFDRPPPKLLVMCVNFTPANPTAFHGTTGKVPERQYPLEAFASYVPSII